MQWRYGLVFLMIGSQAQGMSSLANQSDFDPPGQRFAFVDLPKAQGNNRTYVCE